MISLTIIPINSQGAGKFIKPPENTSALVGTIAQFNCTVEGAAGVTYLVNSTIGVIKSPPFFNGSQTTLYLYVRVTRNMTNWPVVCIAILPDGTRVDSPPPAYLHVQALPSAPQHLTANDTGATYVVLTWLPPKDTGLGGDLSYMVSYQDINEISYNMNTNTTYHNVTGLSPNTTYTMTVMADNGVAGNEENRSVSVNTTTKATDTNTTDATHTSPEVVTLLVVMCMVGVMVVLVLVLVLIVWKRKITKKILYLYRKILQRRI